MEPATVSFRSLADSAQQVTRRLFTTGENRLELLLLELQEERARFLHALLLVLGVAGASLLALLTLNLALVFLFWNSSPVAVLLASAALYAAGAGGLYWRLARLLRDWTMLAATLDQLRKDRECLGANAA